MENCRTRLAVPLVLVLCSLTHGASADDIPQVAAVREMQHVLKAANWNRLYHDYCHPELQEQVGAEDFSASMDRAQGKAVVELFDQVLAAVDEAADDSVLVARYQEQQDEYEFILVQVKRKSALNGPHWHLELELDAGQWKLRDTD